MYKLIFTINNKIQIENFDKKAELIRFINGLDTETVIGSSVIKGREKLFVRTGKGWALDG